MTDVNSPVIRCYEKDSRPEAETATVYAGSTVGSSVMASISHYDTLRFYMAKVPTDQTVVDFDSQKTCGSRFPRKVRLLTVIGAPGRHIVRYHSL